MFEYFSKYNDLHTRYGFHVKPILANITKDAGNDRELNQLSFLVLIFLNPIHHLKDTLKNLRSQLLI